MTQKINEFKSWFWKQDWQTFNQTHQANRERTQINKIRNERGETLRIIRKYYEQLYANKLDNLDEMDKFLKTYSLSKLNQEESENLNRQITPSKIEAVIKKLPTNKSPGLDGFTGEFYQTFQEELTPPFLQLFHKIQEKWRL